MITFLNSNGKLIVGIYVVLTIIKLFTANIYTQREEDPTIYIKVYPTISNTFGGSDREIEFYNRRYSWYKNQKYLELFHSNNYRAFEFAYSTLIIFWWIMSTGLIIFAVCKLIKI